MLFSKETYVARRRKLRELIGDGLILLFGNNDSPVNYPSNAYKFRQDSISSAKSATALSA